MSNKVDEDVGHFILNSDDKIPFTYTVGRSVTVSEPEVRGTENVTEKEKVGGTYCRPFSGRD